MKAWRAAVTMVAVLAAGSAGAATDNARPRDGGSGSSSAGERHHSGGSAHSSSSGGSQSSGSSSGSSSYTSDGRPPTGPQLRHPRAGTGTGHFHNGYYPYYPYYGYGYGYYNPYYYGFGYNWYSPFYFGAYYGPGYGYGYGGGYDPGSSYGQHSYGASYRAGQVRVQVQPSETRVYVDGYYAGVADDFDGLFQRLNTAAGGHDISLRLEGYRTFNVKLYVPDDGTIKLQHKMERGTGEENAGVMGVPQEYPRYDDRRAAADRDERDENYGDDRDRSRDPDLRADQSGERALVRLDVQPADASVYVDGVFRGTGRDLRQLRLPAGRHRIEVVRPGYRTIERDVELAPGQTLDLGIDLDRG